MGQNLLLFDITRIANINWYGVAKSEDGIFMHKYSILKNAQYNSACELPDVIDSMKMNREKLPALRFDCGVSDSLIEPNRLLHRQLNEHNIKHTYQEFEGGHEWAYWQTHMEKTFRFFDENLKSFS